MSVDIIYNSYTGLIVITKYETFQISNKYVAVISFDYLDELIRKYPFRKVKLKKLFVDAGKDVDVNEISRNGFYYVVARNGVMYTINYGGKVCVLFPLFNINETSCLIETMSFYYEFEKYIYQLEVK